MHRKVLHVGSGRKSILGGLGIFFADSWRETRLDIDPSVSPDIVASMTDIVSVETSDFEAVYSSHNLEHLFAHELEIALAEFLRVLKPRGFTLAFVPDLQIAAVAIAKGNGSKPLYVSSNGPITPLDIVFGFQSEIANGNEFMAHRFGFTRSSLSAAFQRAGFTGISVIRHMFDLIILAFKPPVPKAPMSLPAANDAAWFDILQREPLETADEKSPA
ncbi:MAG: class I SAM-dependent methyltransferase [Rhodospirillaceae bacterium]